MIEGEVYLKNNLEGMNNDELILFIYQQMLKILNQVSYYFEKNDIEKRVSGINKAIEVVNALLSVLNYEQGGDIAVRLRSLYIYSIKRLTSANYDRNPQVIQEVIRIFKDLYDGWAQKIEADRKVGTTSPQKPMPGISGFNSNPGQSQGTSGLEIYG